jgi:peptidoglycan/xylan/chitin deacetylase (PgdA/CDA1 family)
MTAYGVMFHHFHGDGHPQVQGSISGGVLADLIDYLGRGNILAPEEWMRRAREGALSDNDICLTFDDALRCQYDVALPVLRDFGLTAFWFVYSSVFEGNIEPLEAYRYFRTTEFPNIDDFYRQFLAAAKSRFGNEYDSWLDGFNPDAYLAEFPFYTRNDRVFRYLRDEKLGPDRYNALMTAMMNAHSFDVAAIASQLWMTNEHLCDLHRQGHVIGLHSYSHPTCLAGLSPDSQKQEYRKNFNHLQRVLGQAPTSMAHPCNSYGPETLSILRELGIGLGFRANMQILSEASPFEFPREDHANILGNMR